MTLNTLLMTAGRAIAPAAGQLGRQHQLAVSASAVRKSCCPLSSPSLPFPRASSACVELLALLVLLLTSGTQEQPEDGNRRDLMRRCACLENMTMHTRTASFQAPC